MSALSEKYCIKVEKWLLGGIPLEKMVMRPDQRYRAALVTDVYRHWIESPTINPRKMIENFARRDYAFMLRKAKEGDEESIAMVEAMHITETSVRSSNEVSNDVALLNWLTGRLSTSKKHIHRLMYESNIEWMQNFGRQTGTWQAVKQANQDLARINNDFRDEDNPQDQMPNTNINITGDVSIIKKDRQSKTDEERAALRRKWGLTAKEEAQELEEINGIWQATDDEKTDVFIENEE